jgi:hypothetical protein
MPSEDAHGWTVLATTLRPEECTDTELLQAYQEQHIPASITASATYNNRCCPLTHIFSVG